MLLFLVLTAALVPNTVEGCEPPGLGDSCTIMCREGLKCLEIEDGNRTCQCEVKGLIYNPETRKCTGHCVSDFEGGCLYLPDGDYAKCFPACQDGTYVSCSGGQTYGYRPCSLGYYNIPNIGRTTRKMVFDPQGYCDRKTPTCPRPLDNYVAY